MNISSVAEKAIDSSVFLFLGYKGSGKSSLSEHLRLQSSDIVVDQQQLKSFPFKLFNKLLDVEDAMIRYKKLWRWVLCVKVFANLYSDSSSIIQSQEDLQKVVSIFTKAGLFPVFHISSLVKKNVTETVKATIKFLEISHSESLSDTDVDVDVELLTDYLMNLICCFKEESRHILIIDDLDDILGPNGVQFGIITALINEVKDLNRFFALNAVPFKILVLCRTDMFERLPDPNKNKIKQDSAFTFTWYREGVDNRKESDLINLINLRARLVYPDLDDVLSTFFPTKFKQRPIHSLLDYTRHIPRDFIQLMNHIQNQCDENTEMVTSEAISKGINEYSAEYFKQEIADEMSGYVTRQVIDDTFSVLSSIGKRFLPYSLFVNTCSLHRSFKGVDIDEVLKVLYDCSAIGNVSLTKGGQIRTINYKFRTRLSSFDKEKTIMVHLGLLKALNIQIK